MNAVTKIPAGASDTSQMDLGIGQDKKSNLKELRFKHFEKFIPSFSSSWFVIRVNLLHS